MSAKTVTARLLSQGNARSGKRSKVLGGEVQGVMKRLLDERGCLRARSRLLQPVLSSEKRYHPYGLSWDQMRYVADAFKEIAARSCHLGLGCNDMLEGV